MTDQRISDERLAELEGDAALYEEAEARMDASTVLYSGELAELVRGYRAYRSRPERLDGELRQKIASKIAEAMWSPASGPVTWTDEKIAAAEAATERLVDGIIALVGAPPKPEGGNGA